MDRKRAQMTVFIVLGLVLLAVVSLAIYIRVNVVEDRVGNLEEQVELSTQRTALSLMVDSCLRSKAVKAIELYGVDESAEQLITNFIEYEMLPCIDVSPFTNEGIRVYNDDGYVTTEISDNAVAVQMHLPLTLVKEDSRATIDDFSFTLQKIRYVSLPTDADGRMQETYSFTTPNNRAEITIPENTVVKKDNAGVSPEDMISLRLVDRNYNNMQNAISIGEVMYLMEKGITFSPAATLTIYYDEDELPPWENENQLTLSVYDEDTGIWRVLPSVVEADKDRIIAEIDHFSLFTITSSICSDNAGNDQVIASGLLFKERCRACAGAKLNDRGELYFESQDVQFYDYPLLGIEHAGCPEDKDCCYQNDWDHDDPDGNGRKNEDTDVGVSESECDGDWSPADFGTCETWDPATPDTYGYDQPEHVGGKAVYTFYTVEESGNVCSNENTKQVEVNLVTLPGDQATNAKLNGRLLAAGEVRHGRNVIEFDVENTNADGCAEAQVVMTVRGAGFLRNCGVGEITENCVCGQQNVKHDSSKTLFCCESGVVVDAPEKCQPAYNQCPANSVFLSAADNGCFCNSANQQYNHYAPNAKHYCCGMGGLSDEPCNACSRNGERLTQDCLCGVVEAKAGERCCYKSTHIELGDIYMPQEEECEQTQCLLEGTPQTVSAVIADITGRTIQASQMCSQQQIAWYHDLWRYWMYSWCAPPENIRDLCPESFDACSAFQAGACVTGWTVAGGSMFFEYPDYLRCLNNYRNNADFDTNTAYVEYCVNEGLRGLDFPVPEDSEA